jgi:glycosyltransferase involved in cell wall biosynthesis
MKVTISCAGRFHSYNLAAQLSRLQVLDRLITTYPRFEVKKYNIPAEEIRTFPLWEVLSRGLLKGHHLLGYNLAPFNPALYSLFEYWSASKISTQTDKYIGWSATSERGLEKAKRIGAVTILERGSSHIETQTQLLDEEFEQYHPKRNIVITNPWVIEKEIREYEMADYISVPSSFVRRTFLAKGFAPEKIIQNPYGVSLKQFQPGPKHDDIFRLIYVGQMSLRKGVHYLLEAFVGLQLERAELVLIGGMSEEIKPYMPESHPQIRYLGIKPQSELVHYYQQASVFVICSIEEGMAMVQAQAMACGLPLICTTNTGGDDLIRQGREGFVIPIRDVNAIKERVEWMYLHQDEARQMGASARERVAAGFTWDDYGDRYYEFLKQT